MCCQVGVDCFISNLTLVPSIWAPAHDCFLLINTINLMPKSDSVSFPLLYSVGILKNFHIVPRSIDSSIVCSHAYISRTTHLAQAACKAQWTCEFGCQGRSCLWSLPSHSQLNGPDPWSAATGAIHRPPVRLAWHGPREHARKHRKQKTDREHHAACFCREPVSKGQCTLFFISAGARWRQSCKIITLYRFRGDHTALKANVAIRHVLYQTYTLPYACSVLNLKQCFSPWPPCPR